MRLCSVATEFWIFVLLPVFLGMIRDDARKEVRTLKELNLCTPCKAAYEEHFRLTKLSRGIDQKITCDGCQRRRYGARYELSPKDK